MADAVKLSVGEQAPDFCLPNQDDEIVCLRDLRGKDNTSGCTREAVDFTQHLDEFERLNAVVIGVSPDSTKSHRRFQEKHGLRVVIGASRRSTAYASPCSATPNTRSSRSTVFGS